MSSAESVCAGGLRPLGPSGTVAVLRLLYLLILKILPDLSGRRFFIAIVLWIQSGLGLDKSFISKRCWTGAGSIVVVVIVKIFS